MAKSFKDKMQEKAKVPEAMRYITPPQPEEEPHRLSIETRPLYQREEAATEPQAESKPKKKASASSTPRKAAPPARRALPQYDEETKSRRLQLLLTPSLYEAVKRRAAEERMSVNELVNTILSDTIRK